MPRPARWLGGILRPDQSFRVRGRSNGRAGCGGVGFRSGLHPGRFRTGCSPGRSPARRGWGSHLRRGRRGPAARQRHRRCRARWRGERRHGARALRAGAGKRCLRGYRSIGEPRCCLLLGQVPSVGESGCRAGMQAQASRVLRWIANAGRWQPDRDEHGRQAVQCQGCAWRTVRQAVLAGCCVSGRVLPSMRSWRTRAARYRYATFTVIPPNGIPGQACDDRPHKWKIPPT